MRIPQITCFLQLLFSQRIDQVAHQYMVYRSRVPPVVVEQEAICSIRNQLAGDDACQQKPTFNEQEVIAVWPIGNVDFVARLWSEPISSSDENGSGYTRP